MQPISTHQDPETKEPMFDCIECGNQVLGSSDRELCPECEKVTENGNLKGNLIAQKDLEQEERIRKIKQIQNESLFKKAESKNTMEEQTMEEQIIINKNDKQNSFETGGAGKRWKFYFNDAEDLTNQLKKLNEAGFEIENIPEKAK